MHNRCVFIMTWIAYIVLKEGGGEELEFQHYIGYLSHYIHTFIVHTGKEKERQKSDTERHGLPPQPPWFFYVPRVQERYTGLKFYVPIRRTKLGKSYRCLRIHRTQRSGWYSNPVPQVLKSAPLPLSYRVNSSSASSSTFWSLIIHT